MEDQFFDIEGKPITQKEWAALHRLPGYAELGQDFVSDHEITTRWQGIDRRGDGDKGPPLIFDTTVFFNGEVDRDMILYSTKEEALKGHEEVVQRIKSLFRDI